MHRLVSLSTSGTDPQLHPGSTSCAARGGSQAAVASPSRATWAAYRLAHERVTVIHITEIRPLNLTSPGSLSALSWGMTPAILTPGALRGLSGQWLHKQVAAGRDVQSERKKMSFELLDMHHQLPTRCWLWHGGPGKACSFSELLLRMHHRNRGFSSHCIVMTPSSFRALLIQEYKYSRFMWQGSRGCYWQKNPCVLPGGPSLVYDPLMVLWSFSIQVLFVWRLLTFREPKVKQRQYPFTWCDF